VPLFLEIKTTNPYVQLKCWIGAAKSYHINGLQLPMEPLNKTNQAGIKTSTPIS